MEECNTVENQADSKNDARIFNLSNELSRLKIINMMIREISNQQGLEPLTETFLHQVMNFHGGLDLKLYYQVGSQWYIKKIGDRHLLISEKNVPEIPDYYQSIDSELDYDQMEKNDVHAKVDAKDFYFPLITAGEKIGLLIIYGMLIYDEGTVVQLDDFFKIAAVMLEKEIHICEEEEKNQLELDKIFALNPNGMIITDADKKIIKVNRVIEQISGFSDSELNGIYCYDLFRCENKDRCECCETFKYLVSADGNSIPCLVTSGYIGEDKNMKMIINIKDMREELEKKKRIEESENRMRLALEAVSEGIWDYDIENDVYLANEQWFQMLGFDFDSHPKPVEEIISMIVPEDRDMVRRELDAAISSQKPFYHAIYRLQSKYGYNWIDSKAKVIEWTEEGKSKRMVGVHFDISDIKRQEKNILMMSDAIQASSIGICFIDHEGQIIMLNESMRKFAEIPDGEDPVGQKFTHYLNWSDDENDTIMDLSEELINWGQWQGNIPYIQKNGGKKILNARFSTVTDAIGNQIAFLGLFNDVTEEENYKEEIKKNLEEKEAMIHEIHHRVKNNLQIISGLLQLQNIFVSRDETRKAISQIESRVMAMSYAHQKLYEKEKFSKIDFDEYLYDLAFYKKVSVPGNEMINLKFDCEKVMIDIDRAIPCGIIMNEVLGNAFEYGYGLMEKGEIRLSVFRDQQNIVMKIDNDGRTFDQTYDDLKKDHLGMKLIDTLARQIGGSVRYESVEDGVEFELRFPELNSGGSKKWT